MACVHVAYFGQVKIFRKKRLHFTERYYIMKICVTILKIYPAQKNYHHFFIYFQIGQFLDNLGERL